MINKNKTNDNFNNLPDSDEDFLNDFEQELWKMLKESESIALKEAFAEEKFSQSVVNSMNNCFSFARCRELGNPGEKPTTKEEEHLLACTYCINRLDTFRELASDKPFIPEQKPDFWAGLKDRFRLISWSDRRPAFVTAGLILLLVTGLSYFVIFQNIPTDEQLQVNSPSSSPMPFPVIETANASSSFPKIVDANSVSLSPKADVRGNSSRILSNGKLIKKKKTNDDLPKVPKSDSNVIEELDKVPISEREAVSAAFRAEKIPLSDDLKLFKTKPTVRKNRTEDKLPQPISPVNYAVDEASPVLNWQSVENARYVVTVLDQQLNEVVLSGELNQNSWRVSKNLTSGLYFWKVSVLAANGAEISSDAPLAIFKVITGNEKDSLENTIRQVKSKIVRGVIYFRAGLLDEAERQAEEELKQSPDSRPAGNLLREVRGFKKQNLNK